jgi:hypothetical protein
VTGGSPTVLIKGGSRGIGAVSAPVCADVETGADYDVKTGGIAALLSWRQHLAERRRFHQIWGACDRL